MNQSSDSTRRTSIPRTADGCSVTITSSFGTGISVANLLGTDHFPKGGGINHQETMSKQVIHTAPNGRKYTIEIRKYTPRDCFRLMGVHDEDIDRLLAKEKDGSPIIARSKLYALAGNSIVTNCMTAMFEKLFFPDGEHYHDKQGQLSLF